MKKNVFISVIAVVLIFGGSSTVAAANNEAAKGAQGLAVGAAESTMRGEEQGIAGQVQNQGDEGQLQNQVEARGAASEMGIQRRSAVANAVSEMLQVAERSGGIGDQVREIAQAQNQEFENAEARLARAQERSGIAKFFIGPNHKEIIDAEKRMERVQERVQELIQLKNQVLNQADQSMLQEQIQTLEQVKNELQSQLQEEKKGFSLFGWAFRLFSR